MEYEQKATRKPGPKVKPKHVKMKRKSDGHTADVHPEEVENYRKGDYEEA